MIAQWKRSKILLHFFKCSGWNFTSDKKNTFSMLVMFFIKGTQVFCLQAFIIFYLAVFSIRMFFAEKICIDKPAGNKITFLQANLQALNRILFICCEFFFSKNGIGYYFCHHR